MSEKPNRLTTVIPQGYPLEVRDTEGNVFLVVAWIREGVDDTDLSFSPLVVGKYDPEDNIQSMIISGAYKLPFGGSDYRIP